MSRRGKRTLSISEYESSDEDEDLFSVDVDDLLAKATAMHKAGKTGELLNLCRKNLYLFSHRAFGFEKLPPNGYRLYQHSRKFDINCRKNSWKQLPFNQQAFFMKRATALKKFRELIQSNLNIIVPGDEKSAKEKQGRKPKRAYKRRKSEVVIRNEEPVAMSTKEETRGRSRMKKADETKMMKARGRSLPRSNCKVEDKDVNILKLRSRSLHRPERPIFNKSIRNANRQPVLQESESDQEFDTKKQNTASKEKKSVLENLSDDTDGSDLENDIDMQSPQSLDVKTGIFSLLESPTAESMLQNELPWRVGSFIDMEVIPQQAENKDTISTVSDGGHLYYNQILNQSASIEDLYQIDLPKEDDGTLMLEPPSHVRESTIKEISTPENTPDLSRSLVFDFKFNEENIRTYGKKKNIDNFLVHGKAQIEAKIRSSVFKLQNSTAFNVGYHIFNPVQSTDQLELINRQKQEIWKLSIQTPGQFYTTDACKTTEKELQNASSSYHCKCCAKVSKILVDSSSQTLLTVNNPEKQERVNTKSCGTQTSFNDVDISESPEEGAASALIELRTASIICFPSGGFKYQAQTLADSYPDRVVAKETDLNSVGDGPFLNEERIQNSIATKNSPHANECIPEALLPVLNNQKNTCKEDINPSNCEDMPTEEILELTNDCGFDVRLNPANDIPRKNDNFSSDEETASEEEITDQENLGDVLCEELEESMELGCENEMRRGLKLLQIANNVPISGKYISKVPLVNLPEISNVEALNRLEVNNNQSEEYNNEGEISVENQNIEEVPVINKLPEQDCLSSEALAVPPEMPYIVGKNEKNYDAVDSKKCQESMDLSCEEEMHPPNSPHTFGKKEISYGTVDNKLAKETLDMSCEEEILPLKSPYIASKKETSCDKLDNGQFQETLNLSCEEMLPPMSPHIAGKKETSYEETVGSQEPKESLDLSCEEEMLDASTSGEDPAHNKNTLPASWAANSLVPVNSTHLNEIVPDIQAEIVVENASVMCSNEGKDMHMDSEVKSPEINTSLEPESCYDILNNQYQDFDKLIDELISTPGDFFRDYSYHYSS